MEQNDFKFVMKFDDSFKQQDILDNLITLKFLNIQQFHLRTNSHILDKVKLETTTAP